MLINGFGDLLKHKDIPNDEHLDIEKAIPFFVYNQWFGETYKMIGLLKLSRLLNSPVHHEILVKDYGIDDRWFQKKMGEIDVLRPKDVFDRDGLIADINQALEEIKSSTSWTVTFPLRVIGHQVKRVRQLFNL